MAKTVVLGAGVVGVATAYYLAKAGHEVVVIEQQSQAGLETSFANAGLLTPGHAVPWAGPGFPAKMLKWLGREDAPLRFRLHADPAQWRWLWQFLRNCTRRRFEEHAKRLIDLALYSMALLEELRRNHEIDYDGASTGLLHIFHDPGEFEASLQHAQFMTGQGVDQHPVDSQECIRLEPALEHCSYAIAGGIHTPRDECGDAMKFSQELAAIAAGMGAEFRYNCRVHRLVGEGGRVSRLETQSGPISADAVILCAGSDSTAMARQLGFRLPVHPIKGYSVTVPVLDAPAAPRVSLYEEKNKIGVSRLGDSVRAGGTAEFAGFDASVNPVRGEALLAALRGVTPAGLDLDQASHWAGLRPMSPDGMPIMGESPLRGLLLNTGHGTLGWTLACASGKALADLLSERTPEVDMSGFQLTRF